LAVACGNKDEDTGNADDLDFVAADLEELALARSSWEGTPEGVGLLDFLNAESTTFSLLDVDVALDRRAAGNLVAHRDGGDRKWGTSDDDVFSDVEEVDRVRFVGAKSLDRMVLFAARDGWVPGAEDILGVYDGVSFTVTEAEYTVELANSVSAVYLDETLALDARAVRSIIAGRPIETIDGLSRLYYVGNSALSALKIDTSNEQD
jgi:hypothetical protein